MVKKSKHSRHSKRCLVKQELDLNIQKKGSEGSIIATYCSKDNSVVNVIVFKQKLNLLQYAKWLRNRCVDCGKKIDRNFISTLVCDKCEAKKIHAKFW